MFAIGETGRAQLWVQLRERATGIEFIVMVNHLHRSNDNIRHRQAQALNGWVAEQTLPVIAVGNYNYDAVQRLSVPVQLGAGLGPGQTKTAMLFIQGDPTDADIQTTVETVVQ